MNLPNWLGIPGVMLLLGLIAYGFLQGMKVTKKQEGNPPENTDGITTPDRSFILRRNE